MREINFRLTLRTRSVDIHITYNSCDRQPRTEAIAPTATNACSDRVFPRPELERRTLIDDELRFLPCGVCVREFAPAEHGRANCMKVSWSDDAESGDLHIGIGYRRMMLKRETRAIADSHEWGIVHHAGGCDTRQIPDDI